MTSSADPTLERIARRVPIPEPAFERLLRRRDRKRRNQRIAAGVVGIAVFVAAVWIVTSGGAFDRNQSPAVPGGAGTGPTATEPSVPPDAEQSDWTGGGLPPEGTVPSTPKEGEVVARFAKLHEGFVYVYADGRVLWFGYTSTINEQRLTPEGIDLVLSGDVEPQRFLHWSDLDLPAGAWADAEIRPYVASRYAVCFYQEIGESNPGTINEGYEYPSRVVGFFPEPSRAILRGKDHTYEHSGEALDPGPIDCSEVTTDEARALDTILSDVRVEDSEGDEIYWETHMILPHGEWLVMYG
ncbi:MAG TPA: hypothetical protein VF195_03900 [Actinomycetota bacterium]